ncbi:MAG: glycosyltransferase family 61 protein [Pseudomonadota bacterium]|nr:glycosyltransferase family 61 protein [Pseudomonadota bacterium]
MTLDYSVCAVEGANGERFRFYSPARNEALRRRFVETARRPLRPAAPMRVLELDDVVLEDSPTGLCLYDARGRRIEPSCLARHAEDLTPEFWRAREQVDERPVRGEITEPVVYHGVFFRHWGHFLLESMSRAWAQAGDARLAELPSLFSWSLAEGEFGPSYRDFLDTAGLALAGSPGRPRKLALKRCFLPIASFAMGAYADPAHLAAPHRVARRLLRGAARDPRPVYFSRVNLKPHSDSRPTLRNESELEQALAARGVRVARMDALSLAEQVETINAHSVFIGPWGSALHNTLFSLRGREISTYVLIGRFMPTTFMLIDGIVGNTAHYLVTLLRAEDFEATRQVVIDVEATLAYLRAEGVI